MDFGDSGAGTCGVTIVVVDAVLCCVVSKGRVQLLILGEMPPSYNKGVVIVVDPRQGGVVAVCCELYGHVVIVELFVG